MTARLNLCGLALAGVAGLMATSAALAETRYVDPNGEVMSTAPADTNAAALFSVPNPAQAGANVGPPVVAGDPPVLATTTDAPATARVDPPDSGQTPGSATDLSEPVNVPAPSWLSRARQFVAGLVLSSGR